MLNFSGKDGVCCESVLPSYLPYTPVALTLFFLALDAIQLKEEAERAAAVARPVPVNEVEAPEHDPQLPRALAVQADVNLAVATEIKAPASAEEKQVATDIVTGARAVPEPDAQPVAGTTDDVQREQQATTSAAPEPSDTTSTTAAVAAATPAVCNAASETLTTVNNDSVSSGRGSLSGSKNGTTGSHRSSSSVAVVNSSTSGASSSADSRAMATAVDPKPVSDDDDMSDDDEFVYPDDKEDDLPTSAVSGQTGPNNVRRLLISILHGCTQR